MANKEFNLCVLENVITFDTPLKECSDYEAILGLIKEEIDIEPTEDELEYRKIEKHCSPIKGTKRKRSYTLESVFKSPYKKKHCLKLKSPGSLSTTHKEKALASNYNNGRQNRGISLGTIKPRRSSLANQRRHQSSVSHSEASTFSDFGDENVVERPKKILHNCYPEPIVQQNGIEYKHVLSITEPVDSSNADDEISISSKGESTSLATTDPLDVETANDSYVESSQSTQTSSELRQRLNRRRSTIDIKPPLSVIIKEDLPNGLVKSEDENENFSLTLSPSSKSNSSTIKKETSMSPLHAISQKSICRVSPLKNVTQKNGNSYAKGASSASPRRQRRRKISAGSPLKGLTQELENCIRNGDYVEMCDSETESMSFTFETIQLLNDYEDCNQQVNNKIFDKILSLPTRPSEEDTPTIARNLITPKKEYIIEDPLHIDYKNEHRLPSSLKKNKSTKENSTRSITFHDQANGDPLHIDDSAAIKNVPSTSTAKKRPKGSSESELDEESLHIAYSSKSTEKKRKIWKRNLPVRKSREGDKTKSRRVELDETSSYTDDSDTRDILSTPSTGEKKKSAKKKMTMAKKISSVRKSRKKENEESTEVEISRASMPIDESYTKADDISAMSEPETSSTEMTLDSDEESTPGAKSIRDRRRSSGKTNNNEPVNINSSNPESEERLAMKAAKLARRIATAKEKNAVPEEVYQKMLDLSIKLRHEAPPQHDFKDGVSVPLTVREEKVFLKYASLNKGTYSTAEDEIIKRNWNDFCQDHNWDPDNYQPFLSLKHGKKFIMSCTDERKKFAQFLANGLPSRPLFSVYKRFRRLFDKRYDLYKRYKAKEDANIIAYTTCHSPESKDERFAELSQIMRRSSASLWKRNKTLKEKAARELTIVEWNLPLVEKFIRILLDITISDELIDLKDAFLPRVIWRKMEKKMRIKWDILQKLWEQKLHLQLFAPEPIFMNEIKIKLIEYMHMKTVKNSRDVRWDYVARYFDGYTISFLRYVFNMLICKISRKLKSRGFYAIVEFLHSKKINDLMQKPKDKCLPRISYKDKKAELVAEDMKD